MTEPDRAGGRWTLLTGHGHVLVEITRHPDARIRDISAAVGLTERTVQAIVADLEAAGYLTRTRTGRRTRYTVNPDSPFRHRAQQGLRVGPMLDHLTAMADADSAGPPASRPHPSRTSSPSQEGGHGDGIRPYTAPGGEPIAGIPASGAGQLRPGHDHGTGESGV